MEDNTQYSDVNTDQENIVEENHESFANDLDSMSEEEKNNEILKLRAIAKRRKEQLTDKPAPKVEKQEAKLTETKSDNISIDDVYLVATHKLSPVEYKYAKKIATVNETSFEEALNDDIFIGWRSKQNEEARREMAQLGASRGAGVQKQSKGFDSKDLSPDEHKNLWKEKFGK